MLGNTQPLWIRVFDPHKVEVAHLIALGATRLWDVTNENFEWTTMADVEGNEFCVVQAESS